MPSTVSILKDANDVSRCWWCGDDPQYVEYHDTEWGRPETRDHRLFEKICLEGFQAGLSWLTILRKRENFRDGFDEFQFELVARYRKPRVEKLLKNAGIVRHRGKIESTINNAQRAIELGAEFGSLDGYFQQFKPPAHQSPKSRSTVASTSAESTALSKDLKKRGWTFVGPTTCYAFMQAMGLVNDHLLGCDFHSAAG